MLLIQDLALDAGSAHWLELRSSWLARPSRRLRREFLCPTGALSGLTAGDPCDAVDRQARRPARPSTTSSRRTARVDARRQPSARASRTTTSAARGARRLGRRGRALRSACGAGRRATSCDRVLAGEHPGDRRAARPRRCAVGSPGFDLTFSAPKSVSVLFGVGDDELRAAIRDAHDEAVREALGYLERAAAVDAARAGRRVMRSPAAGWSRRRSGIGPRAPAIRSCTPTSWSPTSCSARTGAGRRSTAGGSTRTRRRRATSTRRGCGRELTRELGRRVGAGAQRDRRDRRRPAAGAAGVQPAARGDRGGARAARRDAAPRPPQVAALATRRAKDYGVTPEQLVAGVAERARASSGSTRERRAAGSAGACGRARSTPESAEEIVDVARRPERADASGARRSRAATCCRRCARRFPPARRYERARSSASPTSSCARRVAVALARRRRGRAAVLRRAATVALMRDRRERARLLDAGAARARAARSSSRVAAPRRASGASRDRERGRACDRARGRRSSDEQRAMVRRLMLDGDGVARRRRAGGDGQDVRARRRARGVGGERPPRARRGGRAARGARARGGRRHPRARASRRCSRTLDAVRCDAAAALRCSWSTRPAWCRRASSRELVERVARGSTASSCSSATTASCRSSGPAARSAALLHAAAGDRADARTAGRSAEWERDALRARARRCGAPRRSSATSDTSRIVVGEDADALRQRLVADWWAARDLDGAVMIAHRRVDVADLNGRAHALMRAAGALGAEELTVAGAAFAVGDRVVLRRNDRALGVVNGDRGAVVAVDPARGRARRSTLGGGRRHAAARVSRARRPAWPSGARARLRDHRRISRRA